MSLPPDLLGDKYEVLHKIREGGMGEIYKVRHRLLDEIRVVKLIRQKHAEDEELRQRFFYEARTTIRLRHPGIAQIYDFSVAPDGTAVIVMEYIDGFSLKDLLERSGPPELGLTIEIALQSLAALSYLHKEGYLHRDISPDNLMLTRGFDGRPQVKVIDLGLAKRLGGDSMKTATGTFLGKATYSAPEQFGQGELGPYSDIYSFGVMLYELLTGQRPIAGEEFAQLVGGHLFHPPRPFAESDPGGRVPEALRRVVMRTLAKEPAQRFPSAEAMAQALAPFRASFRSPFGMDDGSATIAVTASPVSATFSEPEATVAAATTSAPPASTVVSSPLRKLASRRPVRLAGAAAVLVVLAAATWSWMRPSRSDYAGALAAIRSESWSTAAQLLRRASENDPRENASPVPVGDGAEEPYLPWYYLGFAKYKMNNYPGALAAWETSAAQGAVFATPAGQELRSYRAEIDALVVQELDAAGKKVLSASDYAGLVGEMLSDETLAEVWQHEPALETDARAAVQDFERVKSDLETLAPRIRSGSVDSETWDRLQEVAGEADAIRGKLVDLSNRVVELGDGGRPGS